MAIMDFFRAQPTPAAAAPTQQLPQGQSQQTPPGNIPAGGGVADSNNSTIPQGTDTTGGAVASPLDGFQDFWQPPTNPVAEQPIFGNVDPKKLMEAASQTDFSKSITPEIQAAIKAGGPEAMQAMVTAMNRMTQTSYANSAMATTKIVEQALAKQQAAFEAKLPQILKQHTLSDTLRSENPLYSNPAVQPLISAMERQIALKHPNATSQELSAMARQYVASLGAVFNPTLATKETNSSGTAEMDWSTFL